MVRAREAALIWLLSFTIVAMFWSDAAYQGVLGIARADDWSYLLTQSAFDEGRGFMMNNWAVTMLIGQTLVAWPIGVVTGGSVVAFQALVATSAVVALASCTLLLRRSLGWFASAVSVLALALGPLFAPSAISFMTDVPAFLLEVLCLLAGVTALTRAAPGRWLVVSAVLGLVGFTFRDYAIAAPLVVLLCALVRWWPNRHARWSIAGLAAIVLAFALVAYVWRHSLPNDLQLGGWDALTSLGLVCRALVTLALLVLPALLVLSPRRLWRAYRSLEVGWQVVGVALWLVVLAGSRGQLLGNVLHPFGDTWLVAGAGIRLMPLTLWRILLILAALAFTVLLTLGICGLAALASAFRSAGLRTALDRVNPAGRLIIAFPIALVIAHCLATIVFGAWLIDRYLIAAVPFVAGSVFITACHLRLCASPASRSRAVVIAGIALLAVLGSTVWHFATTVEGARWRLAGQVAVMQSLPPGSVDGGVQFFSYHQPTVGLGAQEVPTRPGRQWWTERYPDARVCATVQFVEPGQPPLGGAPELARREVRDPFTTDFDAVAVSGPDNCLK